jgi:hypothetical protein
MALFVFGAGATRGASFVKPDREPCLPPLDGDFFTQLQRVRNPKHRKLISDVMKDVVDLFGVNFDTTMEEVFSTLENTTRMLATTGENRDFRKKDLKERRDRLVQALAVVLEDSLAEKDRNGRSRLSTKTCDHHKKFVENILRPNDDIVTFNYDCVLDDSLRDFGDDKWNPRYGYGFNLGSGGKLLSGDEHWAPTSPSVPTESVNLHKLHGSLHFQFSSDEEKPSVKLKQRPYTKQYGELKFSIIPPEWHKAYDKGAYARIWKSAATAINRAKHIVIVGYSLPLTDLHATALFRTSVKKRSLKSLTIVNPDQLARKRARGVLQRGLRNTTRILSVDKLSEFVALDRSVWDS